MFNIGDRVKSKTPAGVQAADRPDNGNYAQHRNVTCVIQRGVVVAINQCIIDYDTWPDCPGIGKITYHQCYVESKTGSGWIGAGALLAEDQ